jgi:hypothetical protein
VEGGRKSRRTKLVGPAAEFEDSKFPQFFKVRSESSCGVAAFVYEGYF